MTTAQKSEIKWKLQNYVSTFPSQRQAANSLSQVCSEAIIVNILTGKSDAVADKMWFAIEAAIDKKTVTEVMVETISFQTILLYFICAKEEGATFALTGGAGYGKSFTGKWYSTAARAQNVYYLECAEYWNQKMFLSNLLIAMGRNHAGMTVGEMMQNLVHELRSKHQPLIILDEVDKLTDKVLKFFITLYNELNHSCGFVWTSTDNIKKRVERGINQNKNGYQELKSRIGQVFIELPSPSPSDIKELCKVKGITDTIEVNAIINECRGDLRRVDRKELIKRAKEQYSKRVKAVA